MLNQGILNGKLDLSVKGSVGSKKIGKIWNSERYEHGWKLNSATDIITLISKNAKLIVTE